MHQNYDFVPLDFGVGNWTFGQEIEEEEEEEEDFDLEPLGRRVPSQREIRLDY